MQASRRRIVRAVLRSASSLDRPAHTANEIAVASTETKRRLAPTFDDITRATQTVFGEGPSDARLVFVGEQPGDREDVVGRPFVGPAGNVLDELLAEAGIDRSRAYLTNTVKHFKWEPLGRRRLHAKSGVREVYACRPWLEAELDRLRPDALVLLGATAAQAILGPQFRIQPERGQPRATR